jgi:outer membrane protein assembly factor BamB
MTSPRFAACLLLAGVCPAVLAQLPAAPGDWPGWRGPDRTGVSAETGLLRQWPEGGPKLLWKATGMGEGHATPSVAGGRVYLMGSKGTKGGQGGDEFLHAVDVRDGQILWSTHVGLVGENTGPPHPGPRATPTVEGGVLYTLGSDGDLVCVETAGGKVLWRRHLVKEFDGNRGTWAYAESPLIDGDVLVCAPGGPKATLLALKKKTGDVIWQAVVPGGNQAGYASTIVAEAAGVRQYIQYLGVGLVGVSAKDGRLLWHYKKNVGGVSAATPIFHDGCVFCTSGGHLGAGGDALVRLVPGKDGVEAQQVYLVRSMLNFHGGVVRLGEYLYGTGKRGLTCIEFKTGKKMWESETSGVGSLVATADGLLILRGTGGRVTLVEASPQEYKERGRFQQPHRSRFATFVHPVLAGGRLYLRDTDVLLCYDLKTK